MGDRTSFNIEFLQKDESKFIDVDSDFESFDEIDIVNGIIYGYYAEMNYGGLTEIEKFAANKLTFKADHRQGWEYGAAAYTCYKGDLYRLSLDQDEYTIPVSEDGVKQEDLDYAKNFFKTKKLVEKYFYDANNPDFLY